MFYFVQSWHFQWHENSVIIIKSLFIYICKIKEQTKVKMEVKQNQTENIFSRSCWKKVCVFLLLVLLIVALALTISIILLTQLNNNSNNNNSSLLSAAAGKSENEVNYFAILTNISYWTNVLFITLRLKLNHFERNGILYNDLHNFFPMNVN